MVCPTHEEFFFISPFERYTNKYYNFHLPQSWQPTAVFTQNTDPNHHTSHQYTPNMQPIAAVYLHTLVPVWPSKHCSFPVRGNWMRVASPRSSLSEFRSHRVSFEEVTSCLKFSSLYKSFL